MRIEALRLPSIPTSTSLSEKDLSYYLFDGPEAIFDQYRMSVGQLLADEANLTGISPAALLEYFNSPLPQAIPETCQSLLNTIKEWLKPLCYKHVYATTLFALETDEFSTRLTTFGVNGWNPNLLKAPFNSEETRTRIESEIRRLGINLTNDEFDALLTREQSQLFPTQSLSCTGIHDVLFHNNFIKPDTPHYCRMHRHIPDKAQHLNNDNCPSSAYCAEGSAAYLKLYAVFLAELLQVPALTVIEAKPVRGQLLAVTFIPSEPTSTRELRGQEWTLLIQRDPQHPTHDAVQQLLRKNFPQLSDLPESSTGMVLKIEHDENKMKVMAAPGPNLDAVTKNSSIYTQVLPLSDAKSVRKINDELWISSFSPCIQCAYDLPGRWQILSQFYEEAGPQAVLFERFSRPDEELDPGDILPIVYLLNRGIPVFRFGQKSSGKFF